MRLILMSVLCLTACGAQPRDPVVPAALLGAEVVQCPPGYTSAALGACLIGLRQGLNRANAKLVGIAGIVGGG